MLSKKLLAVSTSSVSNDRIMKPLPSSCSLCAFCSIFCSLCAFCFLFLWRCLYVFARIFRMHSGHATVNPMSSSRSSSVAENDSTSSLITISCSAPACTARRSNILCVKSEEILFSDWIFRYGHDDNPRRRQLGWFGDSQSKRP